MVSDILVNVPNAVSIKKVAHSKAFPNKIHVMFTRLSGFSLLNADCLIQVLEATAPWKEHGQDSPIQTSFSVINK